LADERYLLCPAEVDLLIGNYSKTQKQFGREQATRMKGLAELIVDGDVSALKPTK
jgi:GDP-D-mannose dehydratase